jgi:hypothetical protein
MRRLLLVSVLLCSIQSPAQGMKKILHAVEHLAIGAGVEIGISQAAGGSHKYAAGLIAAGTVGGFKEGSDAVSGRDTKKRAAIHALTILAGAGIAVAVKH